MSIFPQDLVLENDRVILRPLVRNDLSWLIPFAINEPETWSFSLISAAGETGMHNYVEQTIVAREQQQEYPFSIFDKRAGAFAGSTRFYDIQLQQSTTQLGYTWYGKAFRRTGLNRCCKLLMLDYSFGQWQMERVEFRADARNARSIKAMQDIGCTVEGVLRSNGRIGSGGRRDSIVLSILKNEWFSFVREGLLSKIYQDLPA